MERLAAQCVAAAVAALTWRWRGTSCAAAVWRTGLPFGGACAAGAHCTAVQAPASLPGLWWWSSEPARMAEPPGPLTLLVPDSLAACSESPQGPPQCP